MKKLLQKLWRIFLRIALWFFVISIGSVILFRWVPVPFTPFMLLQCISQAADEKREVKLKKDWVPLEKISPHLQLAVVCAEDQNFLEHSGFDLAAIEKAIEHNKTHKRKRGCRSRGVFSGGAGSPCGTNDRLLCTFFIGSINATTEFCRFYCITVKKEKGNREISNWREKFSKW